MLGTRSGLGAVGTFLSVMWLSGAVLATAFPAYSKGMNHQGDQGAMAGAAEEHDTADHAHLLNLQDHQMSEDQHRLHLAARQVMLTQKMAKELFMVALGIEAEQNFEHFRSSRESFRRVLEGLRTGDEGLMLSKTENDGVLKRLAKVEGLWLNLDARFGANTKPGQVPRDLVIAVAEKNTLLLDAMAATLGAYEDSLRKGGLYSMLSITIKQVEKLGMLTQKMSKELLLIAYSHDVRSNRTNLADTIISFERTLNGLIAGDLDLKLLPAPTPEITASLVALKQAWHKIEPVMRAAAERGEVTKDGLALVSAENLSLLAVIEPLVNEYNAL